MKNVTWTHLGPDGISTTIHLKHGTTSGNLILFSKRNVLVIDYDVFESRVYSFFINDELCEIHVHKTEDSYLYEFRIIEDVDTPLNRWRKRMKLKEKKLTLIVGSFLMACLIGFIIMFFSFKFHLKKRELSRHGLITTMTFSVKEREFAGKIYNAKFNFKFRFSNYVEYHNLDQGNNGELVGSTGLPVEEGDEFFILFSKKHPDLHNLDFTRPTLTQIDRYYDRINKKLGLPDEEYKCLFEAILGTQGVEGLGHLYNSKTPLGQNKQFNEKTYQEMLLDPVLSVRIDKCK